MKKEQEIEKRNRPLTDEEIDALLPQEGYEILQLPERCISGRTNSELKNGFGPN